MTVGEKSTELGYSLAQKVLDVATIIKHCPEGAFHCFQINAPIPADENQRGSTQNFYYFHSEGLAEGATKTEVETAYKTWLG
jgi:hypothetical protein